MKSILFYISMFVCVLSLLSCGDIIDNIDENEPQELIIVNSLKNGDTISINHVILFEILTPQPVKANKPGAAASLTDAPGIPDVSGSESIRKDDAASRLKLDINLYDNAGLVVRRIVNSDFETDVEYKLDISSGSKIDTGLYKLEFVLSRNSEILSKKTITFFFSAENFVINGIESFPPVIYPNTTVEIKADLLIHDDSNPFLRWKENGKYLHSGLYSEGLSTILWTAPAEVGIYSITLEVFPAGPFDSKDFLFVSDNVMGIELFVSELQKPNRRNLIPTESYYTLFHFTGDTKDAAGVVKESKNFTSKPLQAVFIGKPLLVFKDDDLGYKLDGNTGLQIPAAIFPIANGNLQPFTLTLGIEPDRIEEQGNIVSYKSNENSTEFKLYIDNDQYYKAYFKFNSLEFIFPSNIKLNKQHFLLSLSVLPDNENMRIMWYYDGIYKNFSTQRIINKNLNGTGITTIGGKKGFSGIIDELGVYYKNKEGKNSIDYTLFMDIAKQKYTDNYLFADGFDGTDIAGQYKFTGKCEQHTSLITLDMNAVLSFPAIPLEKDLISVTLRFAEWKEGGLNFIVNNQILFTLTSAGEILKGNSVLKTFGLNEFLHFKIDTLHKQILIMDIEEPAGIDVPELEKAQTFTLELLNKHTIPLALDYILILKDQV